MPAKPRIKNQELGIKKASSKKPVARSQSRTGLSVTVYNAKGLKAGTMTLPKEIFGAEVNERLLAQAVRVYLSNKRQGTVSTKTRGEVKGSSRKIYRQKGTGRARHGSIRAPIFVKGGLVFGPKPRDFSLTLPKKMRKAALISALSGKLKDGDIKVIQGLEKLPPKTKNMAQGLSKIGDYGKRTLLVTAGKAENVVRAGRNIEDLEIISANMLNAYRILNNKSVIFMKDSIESLKNNFLKGKNESR
ncbi:MAG: 50S ribosomal protein L4 [Patescibacteria group bacterium]